MSNLGCFLSEIGSSQYLLLRLRLKLCLRSMFLSLELFWNTLVLGIVWEELLLRYYIECDRFVFCVVEVVGRPFVANRFFFDIISRLTILWGFLLCAFGFLHKILLASDLDRSLLR